jgi:hypothetical protein
MTKKRTLNEYRQVKDCLYINDVVIPENSKLAEIGKKVIELRKKYPNDQEFGKAVAILIKTTK